MNRTPSIIALLCSAALSSCSDSSGPHSSLTVRMADPTGDTYGFGSVLWDITAFTITRDTGGITLLLDFSQPVISPTSGDTTAMIGYVGFDLDQDSTTGPLSSTVDVFRNDGGSTGMGVEAELDLAGYALDSTVTVTDSTGTVGRVKPVFNGNRVTVRIPHGLLHNDDGFLNAAAIVGNAHSPTDFVPNTGHLTVGSSKTVAGRRTAGASVQAAVGGQAVWGTGTTAR